MSDFKHPLDAHFETVEETPLGIQKDLPAVQESTEVAVVKTDTAQEKQYQEDFEESRKKIQGAMDVVETAMSELLSISQSSQQPRGFEVVGTLAGHIANLSKTLMDMHKQRKIDAKPAESIANVQQAINVDQAVFVGSTAEFMSMRREDKL